MSCFALHMDKKCIDRTGLDGDARNASMERKGEEENESKALPKWPPRCKSCQSTFGTCIQAAYSTDEALLIPASTCVLVTNKYDTTPLPDAYRSN